MSDQQSYPVAITEPWPRQRSKHLILCLLMVLVVGVAAAWIDTTRLAPLQSYYLRSYLVSSLASAGDAGAFDYFRMTEGGRSVLPLSEDVEREGSGFSLTDAARHRGADGLTLTRRERVPLA